MRTARRKAVVMGLAALVVTWAAGELRADDWPQWRGPNRDGISKETGWRTQWPEGGPKVLWRADVGAGYSSFAVVGGRVYTMGNADKNDTVFCLNADTGEIVWRKSYPCGEGDHPGPRATPTVDGKVVYTLSREGHLLALDAASGNPIWGKHLPKDFGAKPEQWGFACSPLVLGDRLILDAGPTLALNKQTGALVWKSGEDKAGYSSPTVFEVGGKTLLAVFPEFGPILRQAADGKELARLRWETSYGVNVATPIVQGNRVFFSSGYDKGCVLLELGDSGFKEIYQNKNMRNHANGCILWEGRLYGFDGQVDGGGKLVCLDFQTGERKWQQGGLGTGALMLADGKLIVISERGELVVAEASPAAYRELARAKVLEKTCWTMPVLSGGRIYCRNHEGKIVCVDVRAK
ncbi:MAG: PQQ-binding-like beta-propeller repeat protein [Planctomycetota bacterium]|nr:PQQ-binding-like beta-propeller repeat protein [Planctomycetota bacterium]